MVRRGRAALLRLDDLPGRRGGGPPRCPLPAAPARRSLRAGDAAAGRAARHTRRRRLRRRAAGRGHCDLPDRETPGHRRARDLDGLVLRRAARGRCADDPLRDPASLEARARAMILVSLVFLLLLLIGVPVPVTVGVRSEEHTSELQSRLHLVCRLLLEKKKKNMSINSASVFIYYHVT